MQVSKSGYIAKSYALAGKMLFVVSSCAFILIWMNHTSVNLYWQQKYHAPSPIEGWNRYSYWAEGSKFTSALTAAKATFFEQLTTDSTVTSVTSVDTSLPDDMMQTTAQRNIPSSSPSNVKLAAMSNTDPVDDSKKGIPNIFSPSSSTTLLPSPPTPEMNTNGIHLPLSVTPRPSVAESNALPERPSTVTLQAGDEVFFVGDSLMQGIAPHMINTLRKEHNIHSINLSKQSTGLAYPSFFNWPNTVKTTLEKNSNIRLMVIFMGPNDPWNMPNKRGEPYLHFKSEEWEMVYRSRVDAILEMAAQHHVQVIWIGAPNMRKKTLSSAMHYLDQIYQQETEKFQQLYVPTNDILGCEGDEFTSHVVLENNKHVKVRTDDGIHFTPNGQKIIANKMMSLIQVQKQEDDDKNI